jgi:hypothetical protein
METNTLSQEELEKPAKVYQLNALSSEFITMKREVTEKLDTIVNNTKSNVTQAQLDKKIEEAECRVTTSLTNEVKKIHLTYSPMKKDIKWAIYAVVVVILGIVGDIVSRLF